MRKIGEIETGNIRFVIKYDNADQYNHYKVYRKWYENGWHNSLIAEYANLYGCMCVIEDYVLRNQL